MKLKKQYLKIIRILLFVIFTIFALHLLATWLHFLINPFIETKLIGFTWLGLFVNVFELFYCLWFVEYFNKVMEGE